MRYANVEAMLEDVKHYGLYDEVGIAHADTKEKNFGGMTCRPPPRVLEAVRRSTFAPAMLQPAIDLERVQPFKLRHDVRMGLLAGGILSVLGAFALSYFAGEMAEFAGLRSTDRNARVESFDELSKRGVVEYAMVDLSGANLRGRRFHFSKMDNSVLENADLAGSLFYYARLDGTRMAGAKLHGASFVGTPVENAIEFEKAICDPTTALPEGWTRAVGHPRRSLGGTYNQASTAQLGQGSR
jgi:hypothetical protein